MEITITEPGDDLAAICDKLNASRWGVDNDMATYTSQSLQQFLSTDKHVLAIGKVGDEIVCSALCYVLDHPDRSRRSLYVDELDTHPDHRRKGYASAMISLLKEYVDDHELNEVWLTTESEENGVANTFYESLKPTEILRCNLYSYSKKS